MALFTAKKIRDPFELRETSRIVCLMKSTSLG